MSAAGIEDVESWLRGDSDQLEEPAQAALLAILEQARAWVPIVPTIQPPLVPDGNRPDGSPVERMRRFAWVDMDADQSWANLARLSTGAALPDLPADLDPAEQAVAKAARDYYAATLVPRSHSGPFSELPVISTARADAFPAAVAADHSISAVTEAPTGYSTSAGAIIYGEAPSSARVLALIVATAEQHVRLFEEFEPDAFVQASVRYLSAVRELCQRGWTELPALVGLAHVNLPSGQVLDGPRQGRLRPARSSDLQVPDSHEVAMVLETTCIVRLAIGETAPTDTKFFDGVTALGTDGELVAIAGLLATPDRDQHALPRSTSTKVLDPLSPFTGWFTPKTSSVAVQVQLTTDEGRQLEGWIRLEAHYHPSVRVAMKRSISGFAETTHPEDSLIDLVIALESLFGGRGGELRLRISSALAWLLASDSEGRLATQRRAKRVYDARSKLVHGDRLDGEEATECRDLAGDLVLDALERLFTARVDLVSDRDRSARLIVGA